jgi:hypothetical protein
MQVTNITTHEWHLSGGQQVVYMADVRHDDADRHERVRRPR